jgi:RNA polymerase sigma-70 factor, ECF subfamily
VRQGEREQEWTAQMRAAMDGDESAYRRLLLSLTPALRAVVGRGFARVGLGGGEVEDVVQEILLAIHLKRHTWDPATSVAPWVTAIARNKLVDALRRRGRRAETPIEDIADTLPAEPGETGLEHRDVDRMLAALSPRRRDIVRSISIEERSIRETAQRLSMIEGAVRVTLHRSLKELAARYRGGQS